MEIIWIILGAAFVIAGLIGAFLPVVPGLPLSYIGLLILQLVHTPFSISFMLVWLGVVIVFGFVLDNVIPAWATKKSGGTAYGVAGSMIGLIVGLFFPPIGFIAGPLIGAFVGEMISGQKSDRALKSALGAFAGFMAATGLKVMAAGMIAFYYFTNLG